MPVVRDDMPGCHPMELGVEPRRPDLRSVLLHELPLLWQFEWQLGR